MKHIYKTIYYKILKYDTMSTTLCTVFNIPLSSPLEFIAFPLCVSEVHRSVALVEMVSLMVQVCVLVMGVDHLVDSLFTGGNGGDGF